MKPKMKSDMKPDTKSNLVVANVSHSLLVTLLLSVCALLALPSAAIARGQPSSVSSPNIVTYLFVTVTLSDWVSVIDPANPHQTPVHIMLGTGTRPVRIAMQPDGLKAYVSNGGQDTISVIDTQNRSEILPKISVGASPQELAVSPDGTRLYVAHKAGTYGNKVTVVELDNNNLVHQVDLQTNAVEGKDVVVRPDSGFAYVAEYGPDGVDGWVEVIKPSAQLVTSIEVGQKPRRLALNPSGSRLFVSNYDSGTVSVIRSNNNPIVLATTSVGAQPRGIAVTPDGTKTFVTNLEGGAPNGTVSVIDDTNSTYPELTRFNVGRQPWHVTITPDGKWAYVSNSGVALASSSVSIIKIPPSGLPFVFDTLDTTEGIEDGPFFSVVNPGGNKLFIANSRTGDDDPANGSVTIISLTSRTVTDTIYDMGNQPFDLMFTTQ
jgi:YVTN family beta-propeller protein